MGNCQAAEVATTVFILHGNKLERIYSCVSANEVMNSHPGYYVAVLVKNDDGSTSKRMKILRPDEVLMVGHVYRLISFEDVLKQFALKKCVKLGKLLKERGALKEMDQLLKVQSASDFQMDAKLETDDSVKAETEKLQESLGKSGRNKMGGVRRSKGGGSKQWKPALHSIEEQQIGT